MKIYTLTSRWEGRKRCVSSWLVAPFGLLAAGVLLAGCAGIVSSTKSQSPEPISALQIVTTALPAATADLVYATSLGAAGGVQPYNWTVGSGNLPAGVVLSDAGTIAGTATNTGAFNLTVKLSDSSKPPQTATAPLTLQVNAAAIPPLQITVSSLPSAVESSSYSAQLAASGGSGALTWSIASGQFPSGISLNATSGALSGTATQSGSFVFTAQVKDSESTPQTATKSLSLTVSAPSGGGGTGGGSNSPAYYGSGLGADSLNNLRLGPDGFVAAYRFRATHTGSVQTLHFYLISNKPGYSGGDGGVVEVDLETDDGSSSHNPSGNVLVTYTIANPMAAAGTDYGYFPTVTFATPTAVTEGQLYHVVFSNPSADPTVNFVSVDALYHDLPSTPVQPTLNDTDCAVLLTSAGASWQQLMTHTQILQVDYTDGTTAGQGYMEAWVGTPEVIGGTAAVRETFTNNSGANLAVTSVSVRVAHTLGSAPMTVRLEQSDGTLIEQGSVASSSALPIATTLTYQWVTYTFSAVRTLLAGQGYNLVLEAPTGTTYSAYPIRKGSDYGFANTTYFNDGYAQFNPGSGWVGWTQWGTSNRTDGDLQFYFTTTP